MAAETPSLTFIHIHTAGIQLLNVVTVKSENNHRHAVIVGLGEKKKGESVSDTHITGFLAIFTLALDWNLFTKKQTPRPQNWDKHVGP